MGREGVAYTFVTPEEGNELTRIEMRINRLLIRDEMPGMATLAKPEAGPEAAAAMADGEGGGGPGGAEAGLWPAAGAPPRGRRRWRLPSPLPPGEGQGEGFGLRVTCHGHLARAEPETPRPRVSSGGLSSGSDAHVICNASLGRCRYSSALDDASGFSAMG